MKNYFKIMGMMSWLLLFFAKTSSAVVPILVPFNSGQWEFNGTTSAHKIVNYAGKTAVLAGMADKEFATLKNVSFKNGVFETDAIFQRKDIIAGYVEIRWHCQEGVRQCDKLYLRPNKSAFPNSVQYAPIINGISNWQLYDAPYNIATVSFPFGKWFHIKIVSVGRYAEIYVVDMTKPILNVNLLSSSSAGDIVLESQGAHLANPSYTLDDNPALMKTPPVLADEPTAIKNWTVSEPVNENVIQDKMFIETHYLNSLKWQPVNTAADGLANLAQVQDANNIIAGKNTVFAKAIISSTQNQVKLMKFGFSDKVKLYLNGRIIYQEDQSFHSRNAWFLGNIGYFNEIYLPLKAGNNEIIMAVTESLKMNGVGVEAKFADLNGLTLLHP